MAVKLKPSDFVHLHNHTHYSLLDGLTKIPELVEFVKEQGMEAVAVTDHGTMSGLIELYDTCNANGIKPILGIEAYVAARGRLDKDFEKDRERFHITLLAMNKKGYENLCRLITEAEENGYYFKPRIDHEIMEKYNEGIICLSGCAGSEISMRLRADDVEAARKLIDWYAQTYDGRFYLEMQDHGHPDSPTHWSEQTKVNNYLMQLSKETGLPLVVTCDAHYLHHEDQEAHEVLLCVGTASNLADKNRMSLKQFELHVIPPAEIIERWGKTCPEAVLNTKKIADRCNVDLELGRTLIPKFPLPKGENEKSYLDKLVFRGLVTRYGGKTETEAEKLDVKACRKLLSKAVLERIDMELATVDQMGFNGYFLIVQDFINWGKSQRIVFGPGRGSAAGSILAYALHITELDPLKYDLLFERFLNPDRISMPDIDTDIQDTRRDEVIEYCTQKYGLGRVANIATFGKMMAKNAVRDVARVLEVPYAEADRLAKLVDDGNQGHAVRLADALKNVPELRDEYEHNPVSKQVLDFALRLEGTIRNHGVHACGVVIAPDDLVKYLPLEVSAKGPIATQFPMNQVEELGLLKMDFLGLSNLSVINNALRIIRKVYQNDIDINALPLDDEKTYELLQRAETTGVFQLESAGMKRYLKELHATTFEDIIAMVALYRPGPMQFIESFIRRKNGQEEITYLHPGLENALKNTYGILIYQEQFMQISKEWCGFTGGQADTLRKAVGKKKIDLMNKVKPEFIEGAQKVGGATKAQAETFWNQLLDFANYCFNKSHAACYALIAYWTAYLKAHYPDAFMAALLTADMRWTDRLAIEMSECKRMGLKVLGPDINQSYGDFAIVKGENTIRFGLSGIKNVGKALVENIVIPERDENGPFKSVTDFARRVNSTKFNKKSWEAAIKTGAFDPFGSRSDLLFSLESIQAYGAKCQQDAASGQTDLFGALGKVAELPEPEIKPAPEQHGEREQLLWERELMGLYVSAHPLDKFETYFAEQTHDFAEVNLENDTKTVAIGGIITGVKSHLTKSGGRMGFVTLESKTAKLELLVFPNVFSEIGAQLVQDTVVKVTGRVTAKERDGSISAEAKVIADKVEFLTEADMAGYQPTGGQIAPPAQNSRAGGWQKRNSYANKNTAYTGGNTAPSGGVANSAPVNNSPVTSASIANAEAATPAPATDNEPAENPASPPAKLWVLLPDPTEKLLTGLRELCLAHAGGQEVILVLEDGGEKRPLRMPFKVNADAKLVGSLRELAGAEHVKVK